MRELGATRLSVTRTPRHIYAQVLSADGGTVIAQASTLEKALRDGATGNTDAAAKVGALVADRAKQAGRIPSMRPRWRKRNFQAPATHHDRKVCDGVHPNSDRYWLVK